MVQWGLQHFLQGGNDYLWDDVDWDSGQKWKWQGDRYDSKWYFQAKLRIVLEGAQQAKTFWRVENLVIYYTSNKDIL